MSVGSKVGAGGNVGGGEVGDAGGNVGPAVGLSAVGMSVELAIVWLSVPRLHDASAQIRKIEAPNIDFHFIAAPFTDPIDR